MGVRKPPTITSDSDERTVPSSATSTAYASATNTSTSSTTNTSTAAMDCNGSNISFADRCINQLLDMSEGGRLCADTGK